jgi:hypothetical protein
VTGEDAPALHIITAGISVAHLKLKHQPLDFIQAHSITHHVTVSSKMTVCETLR